MQVICVVDVSGSMRDPVHSAIRDYLNTLLISNSSIRLITFDNDVHDYGIVSELPKNFLRGGITNFSSVLPFLSDLINKEPDNSYYLFTDGKQSDDADPIQTFIDSLSVIVASFNIVGFGLELDNNNLSKLNQAVLSHNNTLTTKTFIEQFDDMSDETSE